METKAEIAKAIIAVMKKVKGIDKTMTVGSGSMSYKGVPDQEVKKIIGEAMAENGLSVLPISIEAKTRVDRWEETYNGQTKQKQSIFTEVNTKYLLLHTSGESIELSGYGHGVDSQDKGAGKATTYALKYAMLYAFFVPTGKIDDADEIHSEEIQAPKPKKDVARAEPKSEANITKIVMEDKYFNTYYKRMETGEPNLFQRIKDTFTLTKTQLEAFEKLNTEIETELNFKK